MLNYHNGYYCVTYFEDGFSSKSIATFDDEDDAILYIKKNRNSWDHFLFYKIDLAIIDF